MGNWFEDALKLEEEYRMRDVPEKPFVCPNRECHSRFAGDAHTIANLRSRLVGGSRVIRAARTLHDYLDKLVKSRLLIIGSDEEVVMRGLISRLEDLRTALLEGPMSPDCPLCWRAHDERDACTDPKCIKGLR